MADGTTRPEAGATELDALIIGAGFSGLYQMHLLRDRLGLNVVGVDMADGVGGTWYWNRYPGARCDSESHSYAYFFSKALHESWEWSERYPEQPEIMRYLEHVADRLDLKRSFRFSTRVASARWDDAAGRWRVTAQDGRVWVAKWLITAVGCLSSANVPDIPGLESFAGEWHHTGQWPHEGVDFTDKRVGQIGTGSTGIQAVPVIARTAAHLTVFQRTANYSVPARNRPLTEAERRAIREDYEGIKALVQSTPNGHPFRIAERRVADVDAAERTRIYEKAWEIGGLRFRASFQDLLVNKAANDTAAGFLKARIHEIVEDPQVAATLAEIDHPYAAKRPPIDTGYFETFNRPNVTLVDVRRAPITRITPAGIETEDGEYPLDVIVFATGFDAMTGPLLRLNLTGRDGLTLADAWRAGPRTHLGLGIPGFPNLFTVTGPGSPSVLCNMPVAIEQHVEWIADCIAHLRDHGIDRIEPTEEAAADWIAHVNDAANATLLPQAGHSWYLGANVPGKPRVFMPYAGGMTRYRAICDEVAAKGYEGFSLDGGDAARGFETATAAAGPGV